MQGNRHQTSYSQTHQQARNLGTSGGCPIAYYERITSENLVIYLFLIRVLKSNFNTVTFRKIMPLLHPFHLLLRMLI